MGLVKEEYMLWVSRSGKGCQIQAKLDLDTLPITTLIWSALTTEQPTLLVVWSIKDFNITPKVWIWTEENTEGTDKDVRASGRRFLAPTSEKLFPQVGTTSEEVTNGWGVSGKRGLIIHLSMGWQRGLLWRTHRWSSDWKRNTPANTHLHQGPRTYALIQKKNGGLFWRRAHHLGAHHMPRWLTTCSPGPGLENVNKNTYAPHAARNLSRIISASLPPPSPPQCKRPFLHADAQLCGGGR